MTDDAPGAIRSPNIWGDPQAYERENLAVDRGQRLEAAMLRIVGRPDWSGWTVLDLGCGSGFHLPRFAATARRVVGVEPHAPLVALARERVASLGHVDVHLASAQHTGLPDSSVDLVHARWAYFFGPGCEPGLDELARVVRPGGLACVIDNDTTRSTFGRWFTDAWPDHDAAAVARFWHRHGWSREPLTVAWEFDSRADFESVVALEFEPRFAARLLAEDPERTSVDYAVNLWWRRF